jgi:hypothetical protein
LSSNPSIASGGRRGDPPLPPPNQEVKRYNLNFVLNMKVINMVSKVKNMVSKEPLRSFKWLASMVAYTYNTSSYSSSLRSTWLKVIGTPLQQLWWIWWCILSCQLLRKNKQEDCRPAHAGKSARPHMKNN